MRDISIHAPAKGATNPCWHFPYHQDFNPRSREGSDRVGQNAGQHQEISIHAPAKGATEKARKARARKHNFNPRSREGSDDCSSVTVNSQSVHFNPRSREGSDPGNSMSLHLRQNFNPRSREGSDDTL